MSKDGPTLKEIVDETAARLMEAYHIKTLNGDIYRYNEESGLYELAEDTFALLIEHWLQENATRHSVGEILAKIKRATVLTNKEIVHHNFIPLKSGVYSITEKKLVDYSPEFFFTSKHPVDYFPLDHCDRINKFLYEICENDIEKVWMLEKIAAYCFYRDYPIQTGFMLLGKGSNGKSVYLKLLSAMLGKEHISSQPLQELTNNRFASSSLYNKNANIYADIDATDIKNSGKFKALTGGDLITVERKFKDSFQFQNYGKLLFSCNQLPETDDESDAYHRRWVIVEFTKQFSDAEQNQNLINELTTPEQLNGWFSQIIRQLPILLEEKRFDYLTIDQKREQYQRNANSANAFAYDYLELDPNSQASKADILNRYMRYCIEKKIPALNEKRFWKSIHQYFGEKIYEARVQDPLSTERPRVLKGVRMIEEKAIAEQKAMVNNQRKIFDNILTRIEQYDGPRVPIDHLFIGASDVIVVQKMVENMKKMGVIYEPVSGFLSVSRKRIGLEKNEE